MSERVRPVPRRGQRAPGNEMTLGDTPRFTVPQGGGHVVECGNRVWHPILACGARALHGALDGGRLCGIGQQDAAAEST
eukprot:352171-Chlamydomonas_euryale.AAC.4